MSPLVKIVVGLAVALLMGWVAHGPLGRGEAFVERLEAEARAAAARAELPGIEVRLGRDPLTRTAIVTGRANDVQREGMGSGFGVKDHVRSVPGVAAVRWDDEPPAGGLPLLVETLIWVVAAYSLGVALGGLLARRRRRRSFVD